MSQTVSISPELAAALDCEDWDRVEELWLEKLDREPVPVAELLEARRLIWKAGRKNLARTLLELLADTLESTDRIDETLFATRELVRLADGKPEPELLERLLNHLRRARAGSPSLNAVMSHLSVMDARKPLEELEKIERWLDHDVDTVVEVSGKGVGRVVDINLQLENVKVDTGGGRPMSIPFGAVQKHLRPLPEGDIRRRLIEDPESVASLVESEPGEALVQVLESVGDNSDVAAIKTALEAVLPASRWTSWWAKARKHPRILSSGSGSRLRYSLSGSAEDAVEILLDELRSAEPADRLVIVRRLTDRGPDVAAAAAAILGEPLDELVANDPGVAWQTVGVLSSMPGGRETTPDYRHRLLHDTEPLALLGGISDRVSRADALEAIRQQHPEQWPEAWAEWMLHEENAQLLRTIAEALQSDGHDSWLDQSLEAIFRNHLEHPAQFVWACETITDDDCPQALRLRMTPSLLEKIPDAISRKEFSAFRSRAKALLDGGQVAVRLLMESASSQQAARFSQRVARLDNVEPQRAKLIEQAAQHQRSEPVEAAAPILAATKEAVEAKREELRTLLEVDIPKTLKGINAAAAEGDLRENFEYHMLRDRQELQSARAAKLQEELAVVRILEPGAADTSAVNIGTVVHLEPTDGTKIEPVTILGAWDADLDRRIFANGSDLAQGLLGLEVGEQATVEGVDATITKIEPWQG
jgi:transcription elongation factor GreA